jgi:hypothetical protein
MEIYGGKTTIQLGAGRENYVLLPIIPARKKQSPKTGRSKPSARRKSGGKK